ncbi:MAG: class I SAM-dependent methyltransferase [Treponema sp.]|jgi:23S rRNA G2069 N7-methylase RlmK/C1962 C5-methylase RlmI|nr:class I SAM-dependent methyltransferase [Treponema sp.]
MKTQEQAVMLANRLQKRFRHLNKWAQRTGTGAFRLYDRDIPEIPLVLDFYGDSAKISEAAIAGALYKRPYEKDEAEEEKWLSVMKNSVSEALGINPSRIFLKQRQRQRGVLQYEKLAGMRYEKIINEGGLSFKVNLSDYLDTGLFPDRRLLRALVRAESQGKRVLNLFSYTCSFSVYAAAGGAVSTDSVDLSNTYLEWARENFLLNGFHSDKNNLIRADVLKYLEKSVAARNRWDIIILDPPAFSNSKKMEGSFDLKRDLNTLVNQCIYLLAKGGKLFLSINVKHSFDTDYAVDMSLAPRLSGLRITDLTDKMTDEDFKGRKIPKTFLFVAG